MVQAQDILHLPAQQTEFPFMVTVVTIVGKSELDYLVRTCYAFVTACLQASEQILQNRLLSLGHLSTY